GTAVGRRLLRIVATAGGKRHHDEPHRGGEHRTFRRVPHDELLSNRAGGSAWHEPTSQDSRGARIDGPLDGIPNQWSMGGENATTCHERRRPGPVLTSARQRAIVGADRCPQLLVFEVLRQKPQNGSGASRAQCAEREATLE